MDRNICRAQTTLQSQDAQKCKVFVKNLDYSVDDRRLHEAFLPCGRVISAKVTVENGRSRGFGFVSFSSPNQAEKAIKEMNGRMMGRKPLYVTLANNSKQRKASLTRTEQCTRSSGPTEPHTRPHSFLQRVHSHRRPTVAPATR
ncbi:polyadenylate-binding protein 4-like [Hemibagrus wyckioides]|nr:polyadenylate-binding protein 4-like [Hemibagrus wyckioides]